MPSAQEPRNIASYKANNIFLADINNDRDTKNSLYKDNLSTLDKFVMFRFQHDTTVVPRDSAWFAWYNGTQLLTMNQTALYQVCHLHSPLRSCPFTVRLLSPMIRDKLTVDLSTLTR